jgi:N-acetylneuraminic acid mutarotase
LIFQEEEKQEEEKQKEPSEQQATSFVKAIQQESPEKQVASPVKTVQSPPIAPSSEPPPLRARVSLGASPLAAAPKRQDRPCPRWGHTMTAIGQDRLLIYGGQSFDAETCLPKTLNDVYLYDVAEKKWTKPCNCDGMPRQWHTATYVPERELLISFGGEAAHPKTGKVKTTDTVMVLDTEILLWYPPTVSGTVPSGRSGHTATLLGSDLVVLGGVKGSKWLNWQAASVLHTGSWTWTAPKVQGSAPKPRSYHSAVAVGSRVVVFGGNNADHSFNTVHVLEKREKEGVETWHWTHPKTKGAVPKARTGHSAVLLSDQKTICIYGGWDPNAEDDKDEDIIFQDCLYLDTDKWMWFQDAKQKVTPLTSEDGGPKRVGHTAVATEDGSQVLVFGGRIPGDRFTGDFQTLSVPKQLKK